MTKFFLVLLIECTDLFERKKKKSVIQVKEKYTVHIKPVQFVVTCRVRYLFIHFSLHLSACGVVSGVLINNKLKRGDITRE